MSKAYGIYRSIHCWLFGFFAGEVVTIYLVSFISRDTWVKVLFLIIYLMFTILIIDQGPSALGDKWYYGKRSFLVVMFSPISCVLGGLICIAEAFDAPPVKSEKDNIE